MLRKIKSVLSIALCAGLALGTVSNVHAKIKEDPMLNIEDNNYQYQFDAANIKAAWELLMKKGYTKTRIGVMDTGVDALHEDLKKNLKESVSIKKGVITESLTDDGEHGTHVCGIIAATYGNGKGGSGVAVGPNNDMAELYSAGIEDDGQFNDVDMEKAIEYFKEKGVRVVNMSLGGYNYDDAVRKFMKAAYDAGIVLVAASGNDAANKGSSPASFKEVISVNATDFNGKITHFSDYGYASDISAPGMSIPSTISGNRYIGFSGTSMACPVAAGVASLVLSANKDLTPRQVYNIICGTADRSNMNGRIFDDKEYAYGVIDAFAAVKAAYEMKENPSDAVESIFVKNKTLTVQKGYEKALEALLTPCTSTAEIKWSSSDTSVAEVNEDGYVRGIKEGQAVITAKAGGKSFSTFVTVEEGVLPEGIELLKYKDVISVGEFDEFIVNVYPARAEIREYSVKSGNPDVAAAYSNIGIYGKKEGKAAITVHTLNGIEKVYEVTVKPAVAKIRVDRKTESLKTGESFRFKAVALNEKGDADLAKGGVKWTVTDTRLAEIDENTGLLTAKRAGKVFIKVTSNGLRKDGKNKVSKVLAVTITGEAKAGTTDEVDKKAVKFRVQHILDEREALKSKAFDLVGGMYSIIDAKKTSYSAEVVKAAKEMQKEAMDFVRGAKFDTELFKKEFNPQSGKEEEVPAGKLAEFDSYFITLEGYNILKTGYKPDFSKLKKTVYKSVERDYKSLDKENFNEYYAQIMDAEYAGVLRKIKKANNILELIKAESKLASIPKIKGDGIVSIDDVEDFEAVYNLTGVDAIKKLLKRQLDSYVNSQLEMSVYRGDKAKLKKSIKAYKKSIDKLLYVGEMLDRTQEYIDRMVKSTGVAYEKATATDKEKALQKLNKIFSGYDINKYSDANREALVAVFDEYSELINGIIYKAEIYGFENEVKKKFNKIKTK